MKPCYPIIIIASISVVALTTWIFLPYAFDRKIGVDFSTGRLTKAYFVCGRKVYEEPFYLNEIVDGTVNISSNREEIPSGLLYVELSNQWKNEYTIQEMVLSAMVRLNTILQGLPNEERIHSREKFLYLLNEDPVKATRYVDEILRNHCNTSFKGENSHTVPYTEL